MNNSNIGACHICSNEIETNNVWVTFDSIDSKDLNNINTETIPKTNQQIWEIFPYCVDCVNDLKSTLWDEYIENVRNADCEKTLRRLIELGPPKNVRDEYITGNREIQSLKINGCIFSAKLDTELTNEKIDELDRRLNGVIIIIDMYNDNELDVDNDCLIDIMDIVNQILDDY